MIILLKSEYNFITQTIYENKLNLFSTYLFMCKFIKYLRKFCALLFTRSAQCKNQTG